MEKKKGEVLEESGVTSVYLVLKRRSERKHAQSVFSRRLSRCCTRLCTHRTPQSSVENTDRGWERSPISHLCTSNGSRPADYLCFFFHWPPRPETRSMTERAAAAAATLSWKDLQNLVNTHSTLVEKSDFKRRAGRSMICDVISSPGLELSGKRHRCLDFNVVSLSLT